MIAYKYPVIAKEGWNKILVSGVMAVVISVLINAWLATPFWILIAVLCYVYRDPARSVPPVPLAIVCPVDAYVTAITNCRDPYIDRDAISIKLEKGPLNVISTRSPMEGKVIEQWFGIKTRATITNNELQNDSMPAFAQWVQSDEGDDVVLAFYPKHKLQRPRCYVHSGERIGQGQRCGIIVCGSEAEVLIPANARVNVKIGDTVRAGSDILAHLRSSSVI